MISGLRTCLMAVTMVCSSAFLAFTVTNYETLKSKWQGPVEAKTIIFAGDVFLGRQTEERILQYGESFPFLDIEAVIKNSTFAVMNFESAIAVPHKKTPYYTFQFSTSEKILPSLADVGFTHFGLANNHAYDYGSEGYEKAREVLADAGVVFGAPHELSTTSVAIIEANGVSLGLIGIYAVARIPSEEQIETLLTSVATSTDMQVIFVHWGDEYELIHSATQERLARLFIKHGADLIVGHHPHVVQDIALYDGVPVVYSLGNLVFDQYFSKEVQEGLLVRLQPGRAVLELVPVTTLGQPMQPREMTETERARFLEQLAARSQEALREGILAGKITW